jgi:hypothetical protein
MLVQAIENNVLLHQLVDKVEDIQKKQETNHLVAVALRDHNTIEKVEQLWSGFGNLKFVMWLLAGLIAMIPIAAGGLTASHFLFGWPG